MWLAKVSQHGLSLASAQTSESLYVLFPVGFGLDIRLPVLHPFSYQRKKEANSLVRVKTGATRDLQISEVVPTKTTSSLCLSW